MAGNNFIDYVKIYMRSGKGGGGSTHFIRTKSNAKGGPDGGNGGRGGHIILRGNEHLWTLLHLKYRKHLIADDGESGNRSLMTGADGQDQIVEVPLGTIVRNEETGDVLAEITRHGEEKNLLSGGRGGMGNAFFKSSTHQTPRFSQPGEEGQELPCILELKVLADVGLVGFPNAGKSTLLSVISAAKPKIADYEFTTLTPNLGLVPYRDNRSFVMADIPGIIEQAHLGKGLGLRFLRHIERNAVLLFVVPADSERTVDEEYQILINELKNYNPQLLDKRRIVAVSKCDLLDEELKAEIKKQLPDESFVLISSIAQQGLEALKDKLWDVLNE